MLEKTFQIPMRFLYKLSCSFNFFLFSAWEDASNHNHRIRSIYSLVCGHNSLNRMHWNKETLIFSAWTHWFVPQWLIHVHGTLAWAPYFLLSTSSSFPFTCEPGLSQGWLLILHMQCIEHIFNIFKIYSACKIFFFLIGYNARSAMFFFVYFDI